MLDKSTILIANTFLFTAQVPLRMVGTEQGAEWAMEGASCKQQGAIIMQKSHHAENASHKTADV